MAFIGSSILTYATRSNSSISKPTGVVSGTEMWMQFVAEAATVPSPTPPAGWTYVSDVTLGPFGGAYYRTYIYRKAAGGAEPSTYDWTHASMFSSGCIVAYGDVDATTPMDTTPTSASGTGTTATATGLTTVTNGCTLIVFRTSWDGTAISPTSGWTERVDSVVVYAQDQVQATAGATGSITVSSGNAGGSNPWAAWLVALRPSASSANYQSPFRRNPSRGLIMRGKR